MSRPVAWRPAARADLFALCEWIAGQADRDKAYRYASTIEALTAGLDVFPERVTSRPDFGAGIRTLVHRFRTIIACRVMPEAIGIIALSHGGRDLGGMFDEEEG